MARVKYYDSTTQTWKYADMALQTGIHVGTTAPTNEAMLWVDTASNQIDSFPLTDVQDSDGNSLIVNQIAVIPTMPSGTNTGDILVWDGDEWVAKAPSRLPNGFTEVEYIQSTGTQWINTELYGHNGIKVVMDIEHTDISGFQNHGALYNQRNYIWGTAENKFLAIFGNMGDWANIGTADTNRHTWTIDLPQNKVAIDETEVSISVGSFSTLYPIYLFNCAWNGTPERGVKAKLYACQIYADGVLVRDFVPCYNSAGTIGLFDTVNFKFYTNAGTGTFTKGADVN